MHFVEASKNYFLKWKDFSSRSSRSEFWWGYLASYMIALVLGSCIGWIVGICAAMLGFVDDVMVVLTLVMIPLQLFLGIAGLALTVRRLHDVDKSGWWALIALTGFGVFVLLFWYFSKGDEHENRFGSDPLELPIAALTKVTVETSPAHNTMSSLSDADEKPLVISKNTLMILSGFDSYGAPLKLTIKRSAALSERGLVIGRIPNFSDLLIKDRQISSAHLHVTYEQNILKIADMNSTNGSKINDTVMQCFVKYTISVGDTLELADINFTASN